MKIICEDCKWTGHQSQMLHAAHPFKHGEGVWGCPTCKGIGTDIRACDEEYCWQPMTQGWPSPTGYRTTCSKHGKGFNDHDTEQEI